jgi:hypothetical protein
MFVSLSLALDSCPEPASPEMVEVRLDLSPFPELVEARLELSPLALEGRPLLAFLAPRPPPRKSALTD